MPVRPCSTGCWPEDRGTLILRIEDTDLSGLRANQSRRSSRTSLWRVSTGPKGSTPAAIAVRIGSRTAAHVSRLRGGAPVVGRRVSLLLFGRPARSRTRQAALAAGRPPKYVGRCRNIARDEARRRIESGEKAVIRFRVPDGTRDVVFNDLVRGEVRFSTDVIGDPVLVRSGGVPAYNYAVVIDDALMEITHVIRGEDHISNTPRQVLLYQAFGWLPPIFAHVPYVLGPDHAPLSKRHGATSVSESAPAAICRRRSRTTWR